MNLLPLDPSVAGMDRDTEIFDALAAVDDMALLFIDGQEQLPCQM